MHHGTIMFDSDLDVMHRALAAPKDKIDSGGTSLKKSMVTNIRPYLQNDISISEFIDYLRQSIAAENNMREYKLTAKDVQAVSMLRTSVYDTREWNFGRSQSNRVSKERRVDGCGTVQVCMDITGGLIRDAGFFGDFFGSADVREIAELLIGKKPEEAELREALANVDIGRYFYKMDIDDFIALILDI